MRANFPIVVMISGRGSNLEALLNAPEAQYYQTISVISDNADAPGLEHARRRNIPFTAFPRGSFESRAEQKAAIYRAVEELRPAAIVLAGFMQIVEAEFVQRHFGQLLNVHPSLLPEFPGLHTHERVLAFRDAERAAGRSRALQNGRMQHGATVHFVDAGMDTGPIISQAALSVADEDTVDTLAQRVLELEHRLYPWALGALARGLIKLEGRVVRYAPEAREEAKVRGFSLSACAP